MLDTRFLSRVVNALLFIIAAYLITHSVRGLTNPNEE